MASENGWEPLHPTADQLEWVTVPGTSVRLQFLKGWASTVLRAFAADFNAYIEPLRDADSAGYTATNSVATSNHLNGTAMDLNWNSHPFKVLNAGFDNAKIATARELLAFYEDTVWWGNDWNSPKDAMHWNMGYDTWNNPQVLDFINRKIRADGYSTFRREGTVTPPPVAPPVTGLNAADVLARATGIAADKAQAILAGVVNGLRDSQCDNVNRIAMWLAQIGHESAGFNATEEYASGAAYEGRADLGNTQPGDGVRFKGRTWIQITGRSNYAALSKWAFGKGIVPTPTYFTDDSTKLGQIEYAGLGPAWYWVVARSDINALSDKRDLVTVTQRINGGQNGIADRRTRYDRAMALGNDLLVLTTATTGDDMASVPQDQWDRVYHELVDLRQSRSPLRHLGEKGIDTWSGFTLNTDGSQHVEICRVLAGYGHPPTLALLREVAGADPVKFPDRQDDAKIAQAILAEVTATPAPVANTLAETVAPQVMYLPAPTATAGSTGQVIGAAFDALEALKNAQVELSPAASASVDSLISVLQPQSGATA